MREATCPCSFVRDSNSPKPALDRSFNRSVRRSTSPLDAHRAIDSFEARVLKFLHDRKISHMDLKPENLLLTSVDRPTLKVAGRLVSLVSPRCSTASLQISAWLSTSTNEAVEASAERCSTWHPRSSRHIRMTIVLISGRWASSSTVRFASHHDPTKSYFCRMSLRSNAISLFVGRRTYRGNQISRAHRSTRFNGRSLPCTCSVHNRSLPMLESRANAVTSSSACLNECPTIESVSKISFGTLSSSRISRLKSCVQYVAAAVHHRVRLTSKPSLQDELFQKAAQCEEAGHLKKALHYRVRALDEYVAIVKGTFHRLSFR